MNKKLSPEEIQKAGSGEYSTIDLPPMKSGIGNLREEAIAKIRKETAEKVNKSKKADSDAWRRSKNKTYQRKMARQKGLGLDEFKHEKKRGR
jgi:hypothetical protein